MVSIKEPTLTNFKMKNTTAKAPNNPLSKVADAVRQQQHVLAKKASDAVKKANDAARDAELVAQNREVARARRQSEMARKKRKKNCFERKRSKSE